MSLFLSGSVLLLVGFIALRFVWLRTPVYILAYVFCGYFCGVQLQEHTLSTSQAYPPTIDALIHGTVQEIMPYDSSYYRCVVDAQVDLYNQAPHQARVLLSIGACPHLQHIHCGSGLYCVARLRAPQPRYLPTEFSEYQYCAAEQIRWIGQAYVNELAVMAGEDALWQQSMDDARSATGLLVNRLYPKDTRGFVKALLYGDKREIELERRQQFSITGTAHVLAVSGLHVGIVAAVVLSLIAFIRNAWLRLLVLSLSLAAFILLSGLQPSAIRAALMALMVFGLKIFQREARLLNVIAAVSAVMILLQPSLLYAAGFQMSVASIAGIALFAQPFARALEGVNPRAWVWLRYLTNSIAISLAAGITVAPFVAWYFSLYSVVSPFANMIIIPLTTVCMVAAMLSILAGWLWLPLGELYAQATDALLRLTEKLNATLCELSFSSIHHVHAFVVSLLFSVAIVYAFSARTRRSLLLRSIIATLITIALLPLLQPSVQHEQWERKHYTLNIVPLTEHRTAVALKDKARYTQSNDDYAAGQYLSLLSTDSLVLIPYGKVSSCVADSMQRQIKGKVVEVIQPYGR